MKQTFTFLSLLLIFLLTNCAPKETFLFSNIPTGQGVKKQVKPETAAVPATAAFPEEQVVCPKTTTTEATNLTASTASLPWPKAGITPEKILPVEFKTIRPAKIPVSKSAVSPAKLLKLHKAMHRQLNARPDDGSKPVNKLARIGLILGLGALGLVIVGGTVSLLVFPAAIGGLITSIISLKQINRNPDLYAGKGKAIVGIVLSAGLLVFIIIGGLLFLALLGNFQ